MTMLVDTRSERSAGLSRTRLAGLAVLAVASAGGWWLGGVARAPDPVAAPPPPATVSRIQVELPPAWTVAPAPPGSAVRGSQSYAPVAGMPARALLVSGLPADASLVPAALRAELPAQLPQPRRTKLAGRPAWTYGPIRDGARVMEVTVAPSTAAVLAVACSAPTETWSAALGCEAGIRSIGPAGGDPLTPAPDLAFRRLAPGAIRKLDGKRVAGRAALARGPRPAVARNLAAAHRDAAAALAPLAATKSTTAAVAALRRTAGGYDQLARAAGRDRYLAARQAVNRAEAGLAGALKRLR